MVYYGLEKNRTLSSKFNVYSLTFFRIVWKEDGQHFAVSHISKAEEGIEVRRIRIFSREGVLQSTSEDVSG